MVARVLDLCYAVPRLPAGYVKNEERQRLWGAEHMRIYFATPQTFWNDVKKGGCAGGAARAQLPAGGPAQHRG